MSVRLERTKPEFANELGRIMYEAFAGINTRHGFPPDFPSAEAGQQVMGMLCSRPDIFGVAAVQDGKPIGSNFIWTADPVAGVGPITIDPPSQRKGIGRQLMKAVIDHAQSEGKEMIRLVQDSFNMTSLSLYASLGFTVQEPLALMRSADAKVDTSGVRLAQPADVDAMDALAQRNFKVSRRHEIASSSRAPFPPFVRERGGKITGYLIPTFIGHGAAETDEDALALIGATSQLPPPGQLFFAPLRQGTLHRKALASGIRMVKVMQLMSIGPYEPPTGTWMPSVMY
ncbi:MAG TPA: GNAT family N-acetyltransferase [Tepidisphaeraceae bacterium]|jgi:predicted N-acetyltransferase YhbS|nr:GNAT family N-acetyltransferase [Tepidisphaeraceae bacterium]